MDEENEGNMMQSQEQNMQRDQASNRTKEMGKKVAEKATKKLAGKGSLMAPLAHILMIIAPILIAIIIIIGIISFLITMPGMVMDQLKAMFQRIGNSVAAFFGADTTKMIEDSEIYDTLDYLEKMGYDLKGFGFLTEYITDLNDADYVAKDGANLDVDMGVIRDGEGNIIAAKSDFIYTYIVSDNYIYTLKNDNIATLKSNPSGFIDGIINYFSARATGCYKILNFIAGPILDKVGVTDAVTNVWGKGLIALYYDTGVVGEKKGPVNDSTLWNWDSVSIDASSKKLSIKRHTFLNNNNAMEFSLDGWTGRYGMPLEFLLSVHVATMMPDLAYDMATSFATNVNIYLHETTSGTAITAYKSGDKYITYGDLETALSGTDASGWFSAAKAWFDDWIINDDEASKALAIGMPHAPDCTCDGSMSITYAGYPCTLIEGSNPPKYSCTIPAADPSVAPSALELSDSEVTKTENICSNCKKYIKRILKLLRKDNDYDFQSYIPYVASVTNHWYRDVYFVEDDKVKGKFVDYDYDYEAITDERWTLYETYDEDAGEKAGEFKLYKLDQDGNTTDELYNGTRQQAQEEGIAVVRKAKTIDANEDTYKDYSWEKNSKGRWTAYSVNDDTVEGQFERLVEDDEIEADDSDAEIKKNLYVKVSTSGNAVQKGEGLRTETNPQIKKIFLQNQYYKYDGTTETAEVITALREEGKYGALDENALKKEISVQKTVDGESKTVKHKASEVSGKVSLNQDSLNAFSMLENTHTLDSDFIYRDFKELIVELGYFEKEELTDETPRLLQWIVPDIPSGGFPNRTIDKNEHEFGTMVHSKGDIDANVKNTLKALFENMEEDPELIGDGDGGNEVNGLENLALNRVTSRPYSQLTAVRGAAVSDGDKKFSEVSVEEFLEKTDEIMQHMMENNFRYYSHPGGGGISSLASEWSDGQTYKNTCCATYVSWVLQEVGVMSGHTNSCTMFYPWIAEVDGMEFITSLEELEAGDILFYKNTGEGWITNVDSSNASTALEHVDIFYGWDDAPGGTYKIYSAGHCLGSACGSCSGGGISTCSGNPGGTTSNNAFFAIRLPFSGTKKSEGSYEGYKGNEAVVSPVTGILLDYGTYDGVNDKSNITDELYRQNVDLKYPKKALGNDGTEGGNGENGEDTSPVISPEYDPSKPDLVGYAKILVLDAENYKKLEANSGTKWANESLVYTKEETNDSGNKIVKAKFRDDETVDQEEKLEDLSEIEKTVYGYKEFAESYQAGGISGYVVYIDGFECYKPDEEFTEEQLETEAPSKDDKLKITLDNFKKVTPSNVEQTAEDDSEDKLEMDSLYEKDETHKMASKKATEKLEATAAVKEEACSTMYVDDLIFIKEGTVLGRTITDFQLIEEYRGEEYSKYRKVKGETPEDGVETTETDSDSEENTDAVIGNYLRILFRDLDDSVVEDVENYMKLDDEGQSNKTDCDFEQFAYFLGCLEEGFYAEWDEGSTYSAKNIGDNAGSSGNTTAFGLTDSIAGTVKDMYPDFASHLSSGHVPKEEAQDAFIIVLEASKESIQNQLTTPLEDDDSLLFALMDLDHFWPVGCTDLIKQINSKGGNMSDEELKSAFAEKIGGTDPKFIDGWTKRAINRGILAAEGRFILYQKGSEGDEVLFDTETPWSEFCDAGGTYEMTRESSGLYHIDKGAASGSY